MNQKTILITGSTAGIGLAGAEALGRTGWKVLIHARSPERGEPVLTQLRQRSPEGRYELVTGDLSDLGQVTELAKQVEQLTSVLDVLWNNAGIFVNQARTTPQGFESQWAVNHLAPFLLTSKLLPLVKASAQGRILQTSSFAHHWGRLPGRNEFDVSDEKYVPMAVYGDTKLANILFIRELSQRLSSTAVTAHAFHPGYVKTGIGGNGDQSKGNAKSWLSFSMVSADRGADTGVYLATDPLPGTTSGKYWSSRRVRRGSGRITDSNAVKLWALTEQAIKDL